MFSKKMLPSKPKLVMPHTGESNNRKVDHIRGQKNGSTDKNYPPNSDKNLPPFPTKTTPRPDKNLPPISLDPLRPNGFREP